MVTLEGENELEGGAAEEIAIDGFHELSVSRSVELVENVPLREFGNLVGGELRSVGVEIDEESAVGLPLTFRTGEVTLGEEIPHGVALQAGGRIVESTHRPPPHHVSGRSRQLHAGSDVSGRGVFEFQGV